MLVNKSDFETGLDKQNTRCDCVIRNQSPQVNIACFRPTTLH